MQKHMRLPTTDRPPLTQVKLSRKSCCWLSYGMAKEMPAELQGRMDPAHYVDLAQRVGVALNPASRARLSSLLAFVGLIAVFAAVLSGQHLNFTRDDYFGLLGLALGLWCVTLLTTIISLLYLRTVSNVLAELSYDCQRMGLSLRMVWWPWAVYADLHPPAAAAAQHQPTAFNVQEMVATHHQPFFVAAPSHVMTAGLAQHTPQQPMYYFVPQQLQQPMQ